MPKDGVIFQKQIILLMGQNVQWDNNTSQPRPNGMSSQDMPDYADHANEIINCTGTGDGNLTVRVYTPQGIK